jgi:hypothetical protein
MNLTRGHPLTVAPFFHLSFDLPARVLVGAGVEEEQGCLVPRGPWRIPTADELESLVPNPVPAMREDLVPLPATSLPVVGQISNPSHETGTPDKALAGFLCLFALPDHLQSAWWEMVGEAQAAGTAHLEGFDAFVGEVAGFLAFKGLSVPDGATFDLVASQPGQRSIRWGGGGARPGGLAFDLSPRTPWPLPGEVPEPRLWGGINLGDEAVSVVLVNLAARQIHDLLAEHFADLPPATTLGELAERFLTRLPNYPPLRLRIEPGEGYRLPAGGVLVDACTLDAAEPAVLLMIGDPGEGSQASTPAG